MLISDHPLVFSRTYPWIQEYFLILPRLEKHIELPNILPYSRTYKGYAAILFLQIPERKIISKYK